MHTTIELEYPVIFKGAEIATLSMRRMKVRDQIAVAKQGGIDAEQEVRLFANLCEVTPEVIEGLDFKDYRKVQDAYRGFLS